MSRPLIKSITLLLLLALTAGGWIVYRERQPAPAPTYGTASVTRGELVQAVSATGTLSPLIKVQVGSQVSGVIQHLYADFNTAVKKDQVIAQIEPSLFRTQVAQAEANVRNAEAARDKAWVSVLDARRQLARVEKLRQQNMVSESELDAARFAEEAALVEHTLRGAAIAQAEATLEQAQVNLAHTTIYTPIDGIVISRDVDVGQTVAASLQAPTLFTIAQDLKRMQIEAEVDESFIGQIQARQPVSFSVFSYPDRVFRGTVAQIRLNPLIEAGVVKYNCIIHVDNTDLALKPGMTATVAIEVARGNDLLKVPNSALRFVPELPPERLDEVRRRLHRGEAVVWTPGAGGLEPIIVALGLVGDSETEIRGDGLAPGMMVAIPSGARKTNGGGRHGFGLF